MQIAVLSGTNRPQSNTRKVSQRLFDLLRGQKSAASDLEVLMLDLAQLRHEIFATSSYAAKPGWFLEEFQSVIDRLDGLLVVTPEYNGSFPGVLKYFLDMLKFPESLRGMPCAFVGCAAGQFGALRAVEQLEAIFHYRYAHLFTERLFMPDIGSVLSATGELGPFEDRAQNLVREFVPFVRRFLT